VVIATKFGFDTDPITAERHGFNSRPDHIRIAVEASRRVERGLRQDVLQLVEKLAKLPEKLLTKLSGFLISWAIPAVRCPSEPSFSDWISRSCALRKF
jgi:hypothetical protein